MARILIDFVESDKKMIKTLQYFANPLISGLKSFKTHLYALYVDQDDVGVAELLTYSDVPNRRPWPNKHPGRKFCKNLRY